MIYIIGLGYNLLDVCLFGEHKALVSIPSAAKLVCVCVYVCLYMFMSVHWEAQLTSGIFLSSPSYLFICLFSVYKCFFCVYVWAPPSFWCPWRSEAVLGPLELEL